MTQDGADIFPANHLTEQKTGLSNPSLGCY